MSKTIGSIQNMEGWIKSYRALMDNPVVCKDAEHYAVWGYILHHAVHTRTEALFAGRRITLQPGQLITGRKKIAGTFRINETKVYRVLKRFEIEHQIEQRTSNASTLITVVNWRKYQPGEPVGERLPHNRRTATEQPVNTIQERQNSRNNDSPYRAYGGKPDYSAGISELSHDLGGQQLWLEQVAMQRGLKNPQEAREWLQKFFGELRIRGDTIKSVNDTKSHFVSWLQIQLDKQKQQTLKTQRNASIPKRLAGSDFD